LILSTLLQKRISAPILALTRAAETITQRGDYSVRAPKLTEDELGTFTDAFNRMLSETQENQDRLVEQARLLDVSTDAIIVRDLQGTIQFWNRGAEELYGWSQSQALGERKHQLLQTEFPSRWSKSWTGCTETGAGPANWSSAGATAAVFTSAPAGSLTKGWLAICQEC
jgi:nitrogen fixation/metabolism regulation signal transduction histidine kinase